MIGERLQMQREMRGLSRTELAERLGVDRTTVRNWENGHSNPTEKHLIELAGVLDLNTDWLLGVRPRKQWHGIRSVSEAALDLMERALA